MGTQGLMAQSAMEAELLAGPLAMKEAVFLPAHVDVAGLQGEILLCIQKIAVLHAAGNQTCIQLAC